NDQTTATLCPTGEYSDWTLYNGVYEYCIANEEYHNTLGSVIGTTESIKSNYEYAGETDSYLYRYQLDVLKHYRHLDDNVTIEPTITRSWNTYFKYNGEFLFFALFLIVCAIAVMLGDRQNGFYTIESTCKNGRRITFAAKFGALMAVSALTVLIFTASSLVAVFSISYFASPLAPVQSVEALRLVPYEISILGFLAMFTGVKIMSACVFSATVGALCVLVKHYAFAFALGAGFIGLNYYVTTLDVLQVKQWKYLSLWLTCDAEETLSRFRSVDVCGDSVDILAVFALAAVEILALSLAVCLAFHHSRNARSAEREDIFALIGKIKNCLAAFFAKISLGKKKKPFKGKTSVTAFELAKNKFVLISLVFLLIIKIFASADYFTPVERTYDRLYKKYVSEIAGVYSDEKLKYIDTKYSECERIIQKKTYMENSYYAGKISDTEFEDYMREYNTASASIKVLADLKTQARYLQRIYKFSGIEGSFFYEADVLHYTGKGVDFLLLLFVGVLGCNSYVKEYGKTSSQGSISQILKSTKKGRMCTFSRKLGIVLVFSAIAWILFEAVDLVFFLGRYELPPLSVLLVSSQSYKNAPEVFTLSNYFVFKTVISFFGTLVVAALCFAISQLLRDFTLVFTSAAACIVIPNVIYSAGATVCGYFDITMVYNTDGLFRLSLGASAERPMMWFIIFTCFAVMCAIVLCTVAARQIKKGGRV
ncbi:MAG: hypothetical protein IJW21_09130, partial [Clostridia bacterium]|nr:hypothetical protein [Clostridia bacterium]